MKKFTALFGLVILLAIGVFALRSGNEALQERVEKLEATLNEGPPEELLVVDMDYLYGQYKKATGAEERFEKMLSKLNEGLEGKREELASGLKDLEEKRGELSKAKDKKISTKQRESLVKEIQEMAKALGDKNEVFATESKKVGEAVKQESMRISRQLYDDLQRIIKRQAEAHGARYVINLQAKDNNGIPICLYSHNPQDITQDILGEFEGLLKQKPPKKAKESTPKVPAPASSESAPPPTKPSEKRAANAGS